MYPIPFLDIPPLKDAQGTVQLPGSKSISNRVLLLAGLAKGTTTVHDLLESDDTHVMLQALQTLGCALKWRQTSEGKVLDIQGLGGQLKTQHADLFLGNAGTAMRPLTAALATMAAMQGGRFTLSGIARMHERPIADLVDALHQLGCCIDYLGATGYPPLQISGKPDANKNETIAFNLAQPIRVRGDVSSQFLTALLLALPLVSDLGEVVLEVQGELISKPYIEITLALLKRFGIHVQRQGWARFSIPKNSQYHAPGHIYVEGDASSASYFVAMGAIAAIDKPLRIQGVGRDSIQGDIRFLEAAQAMGADIQAQANHIQVKRGAWPLKAIALDCNYIPDAAMTLCAMALYANGTTRLTGIASWRVKETDRIEAMACELRKVGAKVQSGNDWIAITPPHSWQSASFATYDDHRMAMCLSLTAFHGLTHPAPQPSAIHSPMRIQDPRCVGKTFPDYFENFFHCASSSAEDIPVITIDGPSSSGKGTLASALAQQLGYAYLDSGSLYRAVGIAALREGLISHQSDPAQDIVHETSIAKLAAQLKLRFTTQGVWLNEECIEDELRLEVTGTLASRVSVLPAVRAALDTLQLSFRQLPGLVADGRDMGTKIFPDASLKVFLTASPEKRAQRRAKQLFSKGIETIIEDLAAELQARDLRDTTRSVSPLAPAQDAMMLDNSDLTIEQSVQQVLSWWAQRRPFESGSLMTRA
jgi:3-phosphoshikimate 1-carboxyvinyltransferase